MKINVIFILTEVRLHVAVILESFSALSAVASLQASVRKSADI